MSDASPPPGEDPADRTPHPPAPRLPGEAPQPQQPAFAQPAAAYDPSKPVFRKPTDPQPEWQPNAGWQTGAPSQSLWADPHGQPQPAPGGPAAPGQYAYGAPYGAPPVIGGADPMGFPPEDPVRPWPWWIAFVGFAMALVVVIVASIVLGIVVTLFAGEGVDAVSEYDYLFGLAQDVLWVGVAIGVPLMVVRWIRPEHLGLRKRPPGWAALKTVLILVGFYVLAAVYSLAMGLDENSNELLQDTGFGDSVGKDVAYAVLYAIAAPVAEELLFRGVLYKGLRDGFRGRMGRGPAVLLGALLSGVIFGGAHIGGGQDSYLPVLIGLGVLLALAYEWSGTIYVPIAIHSINNAIATGSSADPTVDWIYGIIIAAPLLSVLVAVGIGRFVRRLRSEPPPALPPSFPGPPPQWPQAGPSSGRPPGV